MLRSHARIASRRTPEPLSPRAGSRPAPAGHAPGAHGALRGAGVAAGASAQRPGLSARRASDQAPLPVGVRTVSPPLAVRQRAGAGIDSARWRGLGRILFRAGGLPAAQTRSDSDPSTAVG